MPITYSVSVERPSEHRAQFTIKVPDVHAPTVDLVLPVWVPGSYLIQNTARAIRELHAWTEGRGRPLPVERVEKARWRITCEGVEQLEVDYVAYGHQMITEALDVTPEHLFLNAALALPYVDGRKEEPHDVVLHLPDGWRVYTELTEVSRHPVRLRAEDYDELVDSPIDCGTPVELGHVAAGIPHRIVLCGPGGNYEPHRLEEDLRRIAETTIRLFGGSPLKRYTWFYHLHEISDGALEHRASVSAVVPRTTFRPASAYRWFLLLSAHEYFHLYNVKRIRPKVLGPFDYTRENYTRLLWAMEGTTDYYAHVILRRAGLVSPEKFLEMVAKGARGLLLTPGRAVTDLESASLKSWIDFYQPYEETVNQSVSYYLKGLLVSLCLDLDIRHRTENRQSLDSVFRHLWTEFGSAGRGLGEEELLPVMESVSGLDLGPFFDRYVRGTEELDLAGFARYAGLEFRPKEKPREPEDDEPAGYLGIDTEDRNGHVRVVRVLDGGAGRRAGISPGDELIAINGVRVTHRDYSKALERLPAGTEVELAVFRRGWLTTLTATMGQAPPEAYEFRPLADPTPLARQIFESWLEAAWKAPKAEGKPPS